LCWHLSCHYNCYSISSLSAHNSKGAVNYLFGNVWHQDNNRLIDWCRRCFVNSMAIRLGNNWRRCVLNKYVVYEKQRPRNRRLKQKLPSSVGQFGLGFFMVWFLQYLVHWRRTH
jgi:hypothetical protein